MFYICINNFTMIAADMMSSDEVLDYIRKAQKTLRPVNVSKFAEETGINYSILSHAINNKPHTSNGRVPTIQMKYLHRATELIQALQQEQLNEKSA